MCRKLLHIKISIYYCQVIMNMKGENDGKYKITLTLNVTSFLVKFIFLLY